VIEPEPAPPPRTRHRRRVPAFVVPVLVLLPFWAVLYAGAFGERHSDEPLTPAEQGRQIYTAMACVTCHGANGEGGVGPALGDVETVFPEIADHMAWIKGGSPSVGVGNPYGDPAAGRVAQGGMPAFASLSDEELEAVATYERETFGG
jgi:mono/diheme cytochrome c family protein